MKICFFESPAMITVLQVTSNFVRKPFTSPASFETTTSMCCPTLLTNRSHLLYLPQKNLSYLTNLGKEVNWSGWAESGLRSRTCRPSTSLGTLQNLRFLAPLFFHHGKTSVFPTPFLRFDSTPINHIDKQKHPLMGCFCLLSGWAESNRHPYLGKVV